MNDQISRQKLIEELENLDKYFVEALPLNSETVFIAGEVRELIESQPPADQWIPCSRELPKQNQHIIGTFESDKGKRFVCDDTYFPQFLSGPWKLIAWMPAEPYKGE